MRFPETNRLRNTRRGDFRRGALLVRRARAFGVTRRLFFALGMLIASSVVGDEPSVPEKPLDGATRMKWLIDGSVVDSKSGKPLKEFIVTPGTLSIDDAGRTKVRWRDNLKIVMRDGRFQWPRTSGFSEMRFRVSAKGYRPLVTPAMRRGGPYTRMRVRLVRE